MPTQNVLHTIDDFTTGLAEEELRKRLTWTAFDGLGSGRQAMIAEDCRRFDIGIQIRVDPEMLAVVRESFDHPIPKKFSDEERAKIAADPDSIPVFAGGRWRAVTSKWQTFDVDFALALNHDMREQMRYGAHWRTDVYRKVQAPDGSVGNVLMTESHSLPDDDDGNPRRLFQFKFDHERELVIARS